MRLSRRPTRWLSSWLSLALLFMQIAAAAYVCPVAAPVTAPIAMVEMPGCSGHMPAALDADQPQLCKAHCQQGSQTVQPTPSSDAPVTPVLVAVLDWTGAALLPQQPAGRLPLVASGAPPPGSPPLYLSLLVLRN